MKNSKKRASAQAVLVRWESYFEELAKLRDAVNYDDLEEGAQLAYDEVFTEELKKVGLFLGETMEAENAKRVLKLCDIFDAMTAEEKARIAAHPVYQQDVRDLADIRDKYKLSWNELRQMLITEEG